MSSLKALGLFVVLAGIGGTLAGMGWDAGTNEVKSAPLLILGSTFIALAGAVFLVVLARVSLMVVDFILFPGASGEPPPALYKLPEWYIEQNRLGEALLEYQKIEKEHPRDLACYTGQVTLLAGHMGLVGAARKVARRGLRRLKDRAELEELRNHYLQTTGQPLTSGWF